MIRRLLIVVFSMLVAAVPLANTICYRGCGGTEPVSQSHHACAHEHAGAVVSAASKPCASNDVASSRIIELRRMVDGLSTTVAITFEPLRSRVNSQPVRVRQLSRFHSDHIPLRI
jgi:hypothetical protein